MPSPCNDAVPTRCIRHAAKLLTRLGRGLAAPSHPRETCGGPWLDGAAPQQDHNGALAAVPARSGDLPMSHISRSPVRRDREQPTSDTPRPTGDVSTGSGGGRGQRGPCTDLRANRVRPRHPKSTRLTATRRQKRSPYRSPSRSRCRWVSTSAQPPPVGLSAPTHRRSPARPGRRFRPEPAEVPPSAVTSLHSSRDVMLPRGEARPGWRVMESLLGGVMSQGTLFLFIVGFTLKPQRLLPLVMTSLYHP